MAYDAVSNRTLLADSTGRYTTLYDALDRPRAVTSPGNLTISYSFDAAGRRATMVEPSGGRFTYGYSATNLNTLIVNPQGDRTTWQHDANARVTAQRLANGIRVSYAYDDGDRLLRLTNLTSAGATITSYRDTWDAASNRIARMEQDGTLVTWSYDATYQITGEQRSGANSYDTMFAYDSAGNRHIKRDSALYTTYTYDAANQLQKYLDNTGTTTFAFDANGNQQKQQVPTGGITTNTWDFENRLTKVALASGALNTFAYNGDGLRVQRQDSAGFSKQVWDGQKIVEETDQNNVGQIIYTQSAGVYGNVVSQRRSGVASYLLFDPLGSTTRLTDGMQNVTDTYLYTAFGAILASSGSTFNLFRWVGAQGYSYDADLSVNFVRRRYLQSSTARWCSADPVFTVKTVNRFLYTGNQPISRTDPSGLFSNATHTDITEQTLRAWDSGLSPECVRNIMQSIVCCNLAQDWGRGFLNNILHFTRDPDPEQAVGSLDLAAIAALDYKRWLDDQLSQFHNLSSGEPSHEVCCEMLQLLGRLAHSWQDFFAHAMLKGSAPPDFIIWSRKPPFNVTPDDVLTLPEVVIPPTYPGEHPQITEPVPEGSPEYIARRNAALAYIRQKLLPLLDEFKGTCGGYCVCTPQNLDCRCQLSDLTIIIGISLRGRAAFPNYCEFGNERVPIR